MGNGVETVNVLPPSVYVNCRPSWENAYTVSLAPRLTMAMLCITVSCWSVAGVQVWPPLVVRQMPPVEAATYMTFGSDGSTAMPLSRPVEDGLPGAWPAEIGAGPIGVHVKPLS